MTKVVDELVEDALRELADAPRQRQLWRSVTSLEFSSFTECVSRLFDDSGLSDALDGPQVVYTSGIDDKLRNLRTILGQIDEARTPEEILNDPGLQSARAIAKRVLLQLRNFTPGGI